MKFAVRVCSSLNCLSPEEPKREMLLWPNALINTAQCRSLKGPSGSSSPPGENATLRRHGGMERRYTVVFPRGKALGAPPGEVGAALKRDGFWRMVSAVVVAWGWWGGGGASGWCRTADLARMKCVPPPRFRWHMLRGR